MSMVPTDALAGAGAGFMAGGPVGAAVAGGLSLVGGELANMQSASNTAKSIKSQWDMQTAQDIFAYNMSSTAYQRAVADMKAAGINPILAAGSGMQASSSVPGVGSMPVAPVQNALGGAVSSAVQAASAMADVKQRSAQADVAAEQVNTQKEITRKAAADADYAPWVNQNAAVAAGASAAKSIADSTYTEKQADWLDRVGPNPGLYNPATWSAIGQRILDGLGVKSASGALSPASLPALTGGWPVPGGLPPALSPSHKFTTPWAGGGGMMGPNWGLTK